MERLEEELALLRSNFPDLEYQDRDRWVRIPGYSLPAGWSRSKTDIAFQIPVGHPGALPYGIFTPAGLTFNGLHPANYVEPASTQPPFGGTWGVFSWTPDDGQWKPTANLVTGSNLLNWVLGFKDRFKEGQ